MSVVLVMDVMSCLGGDKMGTSITASQKISGCLRKQKQSNWWPVIWISRTNYKLSIAKRDVL